MGKILTVDKADVSVIVAAAVVVFTVPYFTFGFDVATIVTVVSLIFAILIGFFFAAASSNYLRLQTLITNEDAALMGLHNLARLIQPAGAARVADAIDEYMIAMLDYEILTYSRGVRGELRGVVEAVDALVPANDATAALMQNIHDMKSGLYATNQETSLLAGRTVSPEHWTVIITLAVIIGILLLGLRNGSVVASLIIFVILAVLYRVLKLVDEVDSNVFLAKQLAYDNPQQVFMAVGKLPYYPETAIKLKRARNVIVPYRLGVYKNFPASLEKDIRVVYDPVPSE